MFRRKGKAGFSLIEMMVVISIIATILGVLITSFLDARSSTRDKERVSDLAQIEFALNAYREINRTYPDFEDGAVVGMGSDLDAELEPFWETELEDPFNDETYHYYFDSEFDCGGERYVALVAYNMENTRNSNYQEVCNPDSASEPARSIFTFVADVALAGGGGGGGGGSRGGGGGGGGSSTPGCTDPSAENYNPSADTDNGSCTYSDPCRGGGCIVHDNLENSYVVLLEGPLGDTDSTDFIEGDNAGNWWERRENQTWADLRYNWDTIIDWEEEEAESEYNVCQDPTSPDFDLPSCQGCTDRNATNYDRFVHPLNDDGSCVYRRGCTDPSARNYDPRAYEDDGSCTYRYGCTDRNARNYDSRATRDDGSCSY